MNKRPSYYRSHAHYLRARIEVLKRQVESAIGESNREYCECLLTRARRELEFGDVE